jgi:collagenase-like PrtC family protease
MKITAPISRLEEIALLAAAGAEELYCGVVPGEWVAQFNSGAVNRRYFGNLQGLADLESAVELARRHGVRLFLVLNAQHYGEEHLAALTALAGRFQAAGGDAVIVADLSLIAELRTAWPDLAIHVSSVAACRNSAGVAFYRELGVRRVILPRDVSLDEIAAITASAGGVEIEAFILNDGCVFEEGACHTLHLPAKLGGPICMDGRPTRYQDAQGGELAPRIVRRLRDNDTDYQRWLWYRFGCGFSTTPAGYPYGPCGLCALARLAAAGVASVKIAGREGASERKQKSVEMVRAVVDRLHAGDSPAAAAAFAVGLRGTEDHCRCGYMCYYPEVRWDGGGA